MYGQTSEPHFETITIGSTLAGDVNDDNVLNILDVVMLVNFILGVNEPDTTEFEVSDMNNDSNLNVQDIIFLINIILN